MLLGSVPFPPRTPRSSTRTQSARQNTTAAIHGRQHHTTPAGTEGDADAAHEDHDQQVDGPSVGRIEPPEGRHPRGEKSRLRRLGHLGHHAGQGAHVVRRRQAPLPEATSRPRLEDRHGDEEDPGGRQHDAAGAGGGPPPVGQGHENACHAVDQHGAWCTEEPGEAGGEDPTEGLAEDPDDQSPPDTGQAPESGPEAPGGHEKPQPQPDLDPDASGGRLHGMQRPDVDAAGDDVMDPGR